MRLSNWTLMDKHRFPLPPELHAPMILEALERVQALGGDPENPPRTVEEVLALTGATLEEMLEARHQLHQELRVAFPELEWEPLPTEQLPETPEFKVMHGVLMYVMDHPGSVVQDETGNFTASGGFRQFVVGLTAPGQPGERMSFEELVAATRVPAEHLREWLQKGRRPERRGRSRRRSR